MKLRLINRRYKIYSGQTTPCYLFGILNLMLGVRMEKVEEKNAGQEEVKVEIIEEPAVQEVETDQNQKIEENAQVIETEIPEQDTEVEAAQEDATETPEPVESVEVEEIATKTDTVKAGFEDEQLEQLLEESLGKLKILQLGDKVEGEIINITDSFIFVSLGGKRDAYAEKVDYLDKDGNITCKVGETLSGYVVKYTETETVIAKSLVSVNKRVLKEAFEEEIPVNGKVTAFTKGGFIVDVSGVRTFCPKSHIDSKRAVDVKLYVGKNYDFRIIDFKDNGRDIVVSRRAILDEEINKQKKATLEKLELGAVVNGRVVRLTNFGAFVDLGGIEGLLHISELSWIRVESPSELLNIGDEMDVKIIKLQGEKISLSTKALQENPFIAAVLELKEGDVTSCKILRNLPFGSFVEIKPGVEGLIPISELSMGRRINHPSEIVKEGDLVEAQIMKINSEDKKISLSLKALQPDPWASIYDYVSVNDVVNGVIENIVDFGAFIRVKDGITGLMPSSKIKLAGLKLDKSNVGEEIKIRVVNIDESGKRISLEPSELPESEVEGNSDWKKYGKDRSQASESTFADLL
jgi:small subunit ribosomal protein S1